MSANNPLFTPSGLNIKNFYKELGRLLYSVAYADGKVRKQEVDALREFILKELAANETSTDSSGMNQAFYAQFQFEDMEDKTTPAELAFLNFYDYLKQNAGKFDDKMKQQIIRAVEKVASAYKGINKTEMELIDVLKQKLSEV